MKATVVAQNKKYLVEFKSDEQMISFLTNHGHQVEKFDIINEETLPAMEKHVELPKISKPTGWKTLEKSAVSGMTKEKDADTTCMKLGGKYNTFKYEPDASLDSNTSKKNTDGSIDSPALNGDEPKTKSVEDTKEVQSVKQPKVSYKDMEDDSEKDAETEEKKEVSESVSNEKLNEDLVDIASGIYITKHVLGIIGIVLTFLGIKYLKNKSITDAIKSVSPNKVAEIKKSIKSLSMLDRMNLKDELNRNWYNKEECEEILKKYDLIPESDKELEETTKENVSEGVKDYLPRGGFIKDDETGHKEGIWGGQGSDEQLKKAKIIAKVKHANGDRMGRVTKEDLDNYEYYLEQYQEIFGLDESKEEISESANEIVMADIIDWVNKSFTDLYAQQHVNGLVFKSRIKEIVKCLANAASYAWNEPVENIKKQLFSSGLMQIDSDDTEIKSLNEDMTSNPTASSKKVSFAVKHQQDGSWVIVKYENGKARIFSTFDSNEYDEAEAECERLNSQLINESADEETKKHEDDDFEKTHECSWCGEEFSESEMRCEKDMGWLCNHDWRYLESKEGDLEEVDPSEIGLDETEENEDYQRGYDDGQFDWEAGQYVTFEDREIEGESEREDAESEDYWRGYDDGYESAKSKYYDGEELEENTDPITRNPYEGDDIVSYAKSSMWRPEDEELEEGFKDGLKKAGKFAKNAIAGAAVAGSLMTANPTTANATNINHQPSERVTYNDVVKAGKPITVNGHTFTIQQLQQMQQEQGFDEADMNDIVNGIDPYYDGATRPFADSNETLEDYLRAEDERYGGDISPDGSNSQSDGYLRGFTEDDE